MLKICRFLICMILIAASGLSGACSKAATQTVGGKQKEELIAFARTICQTAQEARVRDFLNASNARGRELKDSYDFLRGIRIGDKPEWHVEANREDADDYFVCFKTAQGKTVTMEIARGKKQELKFCGVID